jgi:hypothetical protein
MKRKSEGEIHSLDDEGASPAQANPFRPRYAYPTVANLPKMVKPATRRG